MSVSDISGPIIFETSDVLSDWEKMERLQSDLHDSLDLAFKFLWRMCEPEPD